MVNVEELDPVPFIALLGRLGLATRLRDGDGDRVVDLVDPLPATARCAPLQASVDSAVS